MSHLMNYELSFRVPYSTQPSTPINNKNRENLLKSTAATVYNCPCFCDVPPKSHILLLLSHSFFCKLIIIVSNDFS